MPAERLAPVSSPHDLGAHLVRQQSLLQIFSEHFHEIADRATGDPNFPREEVERLLALHREYLVGIHQHDEELVVEAIRSSVVASRQPPISICVQEHKKALEFEETLQRRLASWKSDAKSLATLAILLHKEADRISAHREFEEESIDSETDRLLPPETQQSLLETMHADPGNRVAVETRMRTWATELHSASD